MPETTSGDRRAMPAVFAATRPSLPWSRDERMGSRERCPSSREEPSKGELATGPGRYRADDHDLPVRLDGEAGRDRPVGPQRWERDPFIWMWLQEPPPLAQPKEHECAVSRLHPRRLADGHRDPTIWLEPDTSGDVQAAGHIRNDRTPRPEARIERSIGRVSEDRDRAPCLPGRDDPPIRLDHDRERPFRSRSKIRRHRAVGTERIVGSAVGADAL